MSESKTVIAQTIGENFAIWNGDSVDVVPGLPPNSVDIVTYSPPFLSLFTYSDSTRDMGNNNSDDDFMVQYELLVRGLFAALRPGRVCVVHTKDVPLLKWRDGMSGMKDFPGDLVRVHQRAGFIYGGRVTIWLDPVTEMQRTKAMRLLFKNFKANGEICAPGLPDYLLIFRKPGEKDDPDYVPVTHDEPVETWQGWASPTWKATFNEDDRRLLDEAGSCWHEIRQTETLNVKNAREEKDERHVCPMSTHTLDRIVRMWSNPGEVVLDPFTGIGSTGYVALGLGRKFVGCELKSSYFNLAVRNLKSKDVVVEAPSIFNWSTQ